MNEHWINKATFSISVLLPIPHEKKSNPEYFHHHPLVACNTTIIASTLDCYVVLYYNTLALYTNDWFEYIEYGERMSEVERES